MANTTIKIKSHSQKNGWFNIVTQDGKEVSVLAEKNPKLKALLEANPDGNFDLPCSFVTKGDKNYAWDAKESTGGIGGGFRAQPPKGNESFALAYSKDIHVALVEKGNLFNEDKCIALADKFYEWMEGKKKA